MNLIPNLLANPFEFIPFSSPLPRRRGQGAGAERFFHRLLFECVCLALGATLLFPTNGWGQIAPQGSLDPALAIVEGQVVNVYRAIYNDQSYVAQILVQRSAAARIEDLHRGVVFPAPGDFVYVHLEASERGESPQTPRPGTVVRASLQQRGNRMWEPAGAQWLADAEGAPESEQRSSTDLVGLTTETVPLSGGNALRVVAVKPESPAAQAGFEVGDILVEADGARLSRPDQLDAALRRNSGKLSILVRDIRTGKNVPVEVQWNAEMREGVGAGRRVKLGVTGELAFLSGEEVVKVTEVVPQSPAARAGLAPGWLIISVDGNPATSAERLGELIRTAAADQVVLEVQNPDNKQRRTIRVDLTARR